MKAASPEAAQTLVPRRWTGPRGGTLQPLTEYRGLLPQQPATFLRKLSDADKQEVYVLLGVFPEVRGLLGAARLLHAYIKEGPDAAARGRTTFEELAQERGELVRDIAALRRKINRLAENVCLILPRVPQFNDEEVRLVDAAHRRVS